MNPTQILTSPTNRNIPSSSPSSVSPLGNLYSLHGLPQIPTGSVVHLKAYDTIYEGEYKLIRLGKEITPFDTVQLINAIEVSTRTPFNKTLSFTMKEIQDVRTLTVLKNKTKPNKTNGPPIYEKKYIKRSDVDSTGIFEYYVNTFVIRYYTQLKTFINLLSEVDVIACTLEGEFSGRNGKVSWVILAAKNTLIPLDIIGLSHQTPKLWDILKQNIFSNENIVKVFHDSRPSADYLYHRHGITLVNVFDTQVADVNVEKNTTGKLPSNYRSLSICLAVYNGIPQEEFDYLLKYETFNFSTDSPWMVRPVPPQEILKLGALKVKHLIALRDNLTNRLMKKFYSCVQAHIEVIHSEDTSYFLENPTEMSNMVEAILLTEKDP